MTRSLLLFACSAVALLPSRQQHKRSVMRMGWGDPPVCEPRPRSDFCARCTPSTRRPPRRWRLSFLSVGAPIALVPAQVFGANAMTSEERRRRQFDGVADVDAAARVWTAASELRERLAALSEAAAEAPAKPATSAGFYGEDELQGILAMHEKVLDVVDSEPAVTEASVFDLHEIVKGMVEGDEGDG